MKYNKINIDRTPLSADEINAAMDFDGLINPKIKPEMKSKGGKIIKLGAYSVALAVVIVAGIYFYTQEPVAHSEEKVSHSISEMAKEDNGIEKSFINPPLDGYEKDFSIAMVAAENGGVVRLGDSEIMVPPNAFCNQEGNPLTGKVELRYREFNDVLDIFLSGIPMEYDSAGVNYTFESNGMFELLGFQNGTPVNVASEKEISIKMNVDEAKSGFSEYYFNEKTGQWEFRNGQRYEIEEESNDEVELLASDSEDLDIQGFSGDADLALVIDEVLKDEVPQRTKEMVVLEKKIESVKKEKKEIQQPVKPEEANPELPQIQLEVDLDDFPELKAFKNTLFQVAEEDLGDFKMEWGQETWTDMSINKSSKPGYYRMVFSKPGRREMVKATPVLAGKDMEEAMEVYDQLFDQYTNTVDSLKVVKKQKEKELAEARKKAREDARKRQQEALKAQQQMRKNAVKMQRANNTSGQITALFTANQFGLYNCDTPRGLPKGKILVADYETEKGKQIMGTVKLIEEGNRSIYHYYPGYKEFKFNPDQRNILITVTESNKLAVLVPSQFKELNKRDGKCVIQMKECEKELTSKSEIQEFIEAQGFEI